MKRRRHIFSNGLALVSVILCITSAALWPLSYGRFNAIANPEHRVPDGSMRSRVAIFSCNGHLGVLLARQRATYEEEGWWFSLRGEWGNALCSAMHGVFKHRRAGFEFGRDPDLSSGESLAGFELPYWAIIILLGIYPMNWILRKRRSSQLVQLYCQECGYDLRATPHRCPECGRAAAHKS